MVFQPIYIESSIVYFLIHTPLHIHTYMVPDPAHVNKTFKSLILFHFLKCKQPFIYTFYVHTCLIRRSYSNLVKLF